jgi:glutaredoxin 3
MRERRFDEAGRAAQRSTLDRGALADNLLNMAKVEIYTTPFCPYCSRAKTLLGRKGVNFTEYDAPHGSEERSQAISRSGGRTTVPQIFINGDAVGGCDDLFALDRAGKLDELLQAA